MARSADFLHTSATAGRSHADAGEEEDGYEVALSPEPVGRSWEEERDWRGAGILSLGVIAGALVGAGVALLFAPQRGDAGAHRESRSSAREPG